MDAINLFCVKNHKDAILPTLEKDNDYVVNFYSCEDVLVEKNTCRSISTGIAIISLKGYEMVPDIFDTDIFPENIVLISSYYNVDNVMHIKIGNTGDNYQVKKGHLIYSGKLRKIYPIKIIESNTEETSDLKTGKKEKFNHLINSMLSSEEIPEKVRENTKNITNFLTNMFDKIDEIKEKINEPITELQNHQTIADSSSLNALEEYRKSKKEIKQKAIEYEENSKKISNDLKEGNYINGITEFVKQIIVTSKDKDCDLIQKEVVKNIFNLKEKTEIEDIIPESNIEENPDSIAEI